MAKIKQLSQHEAQKIAAGEVVERPTNIIKELIENSIDAGATAITIYIEDAGKKLIRIIDNGCGMDIQDAQICFDRHATSKINHVDELEKINTFGFRGEALASIAAVSKIILTTKEEQTLEGTQVIIEAGTINSITSIACSSGTTITISDLFFNVPARKKFLKSAETEWRAIQLLFNAFCFDYPHIRFTLFNKNKQISHYPQTDSCTKRALQLWEPTISPHLITLEKNNLPSCTIEGVISDHQHYRYDKSNIYFFVNKRWIKNYQLNNALIKGYANVLPEGRYPIGALHITVPTNEVDINIHPRKEEVKFLHPRRIEQALQQIVKTALEQNLSRHIKKDVTLQPAPFQQQRYENNFNNSKPFVNKYTNKPLDNHFTPFNFDAFFSPEISSQKQEKIESFSYENSNKEESFYKETTVNNKSHSTVSSIDFDKTINNDINTIINNTAQSDSELFAQKNNYRLIGQYNKTYLLIEKEEGLFLIDQHAAHERILYELFANKFNTVSTIPLLFPLIITLSTNDIEIMLPHLSIFNENGISLEQYADNQLIVQSLPIHLKNESLEPLIKEVIGWIIEYKSLELIEFKKTIDNKLQAQMACKAAVKAGDELTYEKMQQLLADLEKTANRFSCPHGRPTGWLLSLHEIEKKFRRKL